MVKNFQLLDIYLAIGHPYGSYFDYGIMHVSVRVNWMIELNRSSSKGLFYFQPLSRQSLSGSIWPTIACPLGTYELKWYSEGLCSPSISNENKIDKDN